MKRALILFAKPPLPRRVKTRLVPPLTPGQAAALYAGFLRDVVSAPRETQIEGSAVAHEIHVEPPFDLDAIRSLAGDPWVIREQVGATLGERLVHAFDDAFERGFDSIVLRNTDSPALPGARESEAFAALAPGGASCVLGPDTGGGYYLVGLRQRCWEMFLDLPMSVSTNFERTLECARERFGHVAVLGEERDVDHPEDLRQLSEMLAEDPVIEARCASTVAALKTVADDLLASDRSTFVGDKALLDALQWWSSAEVSGRASAGGGV